MEQLLNLKDAMHFLNVSKSTLHRWDKQGKLVPIRTIGKHRRYRLCDLQKFASIDSETVDDKQTDIRVVTYSRCSSTDQKQHGDIERQLMRNVEYAVKKGYNIVEIIHTMKQKVVVPKELKVLFRKLAIYMQELVLLNYKIPQL